MSVLEKKSLIDITIHFPDNIGKAVTQLPNMNEFLVQATEKALQERYLDTHTKAALQEADRGEYATEEVEAFFAKWSDYEA